MPAYSRRDFLSTTSLALAGVGLGLHARPLSALDVRSKRAVASFLPDVVDAEKLRALALAAVDAAKSAGASYADIRVTDRRTFDMWYYDPSQPPLSTVGYDYTYGIRARVNGTWSFAYGAEPTPDAVAQSARAATETARGLAQQGNPSPEFAPAPIAKGEWATPVKIDPFSVSPDEHAYMLGAYMDASFRVTDGGMGPAFYWSSETRVFASTEGSLITQRLAQARPKIHAQTDRPIGLPTKIPVSEISPISGGFEVALGAALQDRIKAVTEEAARYLNYPEAPVEVGRYEGVLDGTTVGAILGATLVPALELDRVLGQTADGGGTSFLAPIKAVLGNPMFSPALNVTADRSPPHYGAAKWDDEGVETEAFPVVEKGAVVDYFGTRATVPALAEWYKSRGKPVKSHGTAISWLPDHEPIGSASYLSVAPPASGATLDAMTKQIVNGLLVRGIYTVDSDQQLTSGSVYPIMLCEVKKGQITRRFKGGGIQFSTRKFWKSLTALGDPSTVEMHVHEGGTGQPWVPTNQAISSPAGHFQEINVIDIASRVR